jgi:hypothetical protein
MKKLRVSFLIVALASALTAQGVAATHWTSVETVGASQSQECAGGQKIDSPESGVAYNVLFTAFDNTVWPGTITFWITDGPSGETLSFSTDDHVYHTVTSVLIKGGPSNALLYTYAGLGVGADDGLHAPVNAKNGKYYGVSHVCLFLAKQVPPVS